jgi:cysteine desulfurase
MSALIYLDHHATTPVDPRVMEAMQPWWIAWAGNAASISHRAGRRAREAVESARETIARCLDCRNDELVFTSGATEANNLAIKGLLSGPRAEQHLIITAVEHRAVLDPARRRKREGHPVTILPVDRFGRVRVDDVRDALTGETGLVSAMLANNEIGTLQPVEQIGRLCRERGIPVHCDAAQGIGKIPVSLKQLPVDLLSLTAHKIHGPQGIGALYVRKSDPPLRLRPLFDGGGHERGLRSGTLAVPLIVGFAKAVELSIEAMSEESARLGRMRDELWELLSSGLTGITRNGDPERGLPGNLNVTIAGIDGDALLARLAESRLCVSSGAACSSANPEPSHVLRALGHSDTQARASLRFGIGRFNTIEEIHAAAEIVIEIVEALSGKRGT